MKKMWKDPLQTARGKRENCLSVLKHECCSINSLGYPIGLPLFQLGKLSNYTCNEQSQFSDFQ